MADKVSQQGYTHVNSANTNTEPPTTATIPSQDHPSRPRRSRTKIILFIAVLIITFTIVIVILDMTIFKVRTPKYRFNSVSLNSFYLTDVRTNSSTTTSSFNMKLDAEVTIKNKNFGPYKYHDCYLTILYRGKSVGVVVVKEASAKILSTKKFTVGINVTYSESAASRNSNLKNDISSGAIILSSNSEMTGQVKLLILRKDRQPKMQCTMSINLAQKVVNDLKCD